MSATPSSSSIHVVRGSNDFLVGRTVRELVADLRAAHPGADVIELDASHAGALDFDQATAPSLFSARNIIVLANFASADDHLADRVLAYATTAHGETDADLIVSHDAGNRRRAAVNKLLTAGAQLHEPAAPTTPQALREYAVQQFATRGRRVTPDAAQHLADTLAGNLGELDRLAEQLCQDYDDNPVTAQRVNQYLNASPHVKGWNIADMALAGRAGQAVVALRAALDQGDEPITLIGAFASKMRAIAQVKTAANGKEAGMPQWLYTKTKTMARQWSDQAVAACIGKLAWADEQCKTTGSNGQYALEQCVELIARRGR
ncbi:DNA polymerase III subunit delta [Bifidobacterium magnum]|uniref:DNA polymerase III subunit delta n=1 Tax=Bifidobacterium magnum TaxID=1692 RepID=UPI0003B71BB5|nr:DNA polymerase III subunit delta [Bifidobacterium magnum]